jgi:hypothetical protein
MQIRVIHWKNTSITIVPKILVVYIEFHFISYFNELFYCLKMYQVQFLCSFCHYFAIQTASFTLILMSIVAYI